MNQGADPGLIGLAISYALGVTSKLSGLVSTFTETERELVAVERVSQYIKTVQSENRSSTKFRCCLVVASPISLTKFPGVKFITKIAIITEKCEGERLCHL